MDTSLTLKRWGIRRHSDDDVFALAFGGDAVAFSEVYRRYQRPIYGYCLARLMEPEAAADATQEVFIRFLDSPRDGIEHPRAWLYAVARNVTIDAIRKRARTPSPTDGEALEAAVGASDAGADEEYFGREDARNVFVALRRLRPRYRTALILRELHHESSANMADALDTTPGAVDTLVSRARDAFGRTYGEVADLPAECRDAVAAIYKRTGSGLDDGEQARLESHLVACSSCKTEMKRAVRLDRLSALLPFLVPAKRAGLNLFERATVTLQTSPDLAAKLGVVVPHERLTPAVKIVAGVLAVSLIAAPIAGTVMSRRSGGSSRSVIAQTPSGQSRNGGAVNSGQGSSGPHGSSGWQQDSRWSQSGTWAQQWGPWSRMSGSNGGYTWSSGGSMQESWNGSSQSSGMGASKQSGSTPKSSSSGMSSSRKRSSSYSSKHKSGSSWSSGGSRSSSMGGSGSSSSGSGSSGSMGSGDSMSGGW